MKSQKDTLNGLSTGYGYKNKWDAELNKFNSSKPTHQAKIYPSGIGTSIFITILVCVVTGLCLGLTRDVFTPVNHKTYLAQSWYNIIWYIFAATMCLFALIAINRTDFLITLRFGWLKFMRVLRIDVLRQKMYKNKSFAIDDVSNIDEFKDYLIQRNKSTKKVFFISLIVYASLFLIITIIMLVMNLK